jgi:hypothetical protein
MPIHGLGLQMLPMPDDRATLEKMPGSTIPVIRQPFVAGDMLPFWSSGPRSLGQHHLYDLDLDPGEAENRSGEPLEAEMAEMLVAALGEVGAPDEQLLRLGLSGG